MQTIAVVYSYECADSAIDEFSTFRFNEYVLESPQCNRAHARLPLGIERGEPIDSLPDHELCPGMLTEISYSLPEGFRIVLRRFRHPEILRMDRFHLSRLRSFDRESLSAVSLDSVLYPSYSYVVRP